MQFAVIYLFRRKSPTPEYEPPSIEELEGSLVGRCHQFPYEVSSYIRFVAYQDIHSVDGS